MYYCSLAELSSFALRARSSAIMLSCEVVSQNVMMSQFRLEDASRTPPASSSGLERPPPAQDLIKCDLCKLWHKVLQHVVAAFADDASFTCRYLQKSCQKQKWEMKYRRPAQNCQRKIKRWVLLLRIAHFVEFALRILLRFALRSPLWLACEWLWRFSLIRCSNGVLYRGDVCMKQRGGSML